MLPLSPFSGIALIIHLIVDIGAFILKQISKVLKKVNIQFSNNIFNYITNKKGDTPVRRVLAYLIIIIIISIISYSTFDIYKHIETFDRSKTPIAKISNFIKNGQTNKIDLASSNSSGNIDTIYPQTNKLTISTNIENSQITSTKKSEDNENKYNLLTEYLSSIGVKDPSFDLRAELALKFEIVEKKEDYKESSSQNYTLLRRLRDNVIFRDEILKELLKNNHNI